MRNLRHACLLGLLLLCSACWSLKKSIVLRDDGTPVMTVAIGRLLDTTRELPDRGAYAAASGIHDRFVEVRMEKGAGELLGQTLTQGVVYMLDLRGLNAQNTEAVLYAPAAGDTWSQIASQTIPNTSRVLVSYWQLGVVVNVAVDSDPDDPHLVLIVHQGRPWNRLYNGVRLTIKAPQLFTSSTSLATDG